MRRAVALLALVVFGACERVVSITVPSEAPRPVVEARLERVRGRAASQQRIRLMQSQPVFSSTAPDPITNAVVRVRDTTGRVVTFRHQAARPGEYATDSLLVEIGRLYTLEFEWNGQQYAATSRTVAVPPIDSIYFVARRTGVGPASGQRAAVTFRDVRGTQNWYLFDQFVNGRRLVSADSTFASRVVFADQFIGDGRRVTGFQPYEARAVQPGDTVSVRLSALADDVYRWYTNVNGQAQAGGDPFSVPPANARGNIRNLTSPVTPAFGYFVATEVSEVTRRVP
jgi:hypothetical protein